MNLLANVILPAFQAPYYAPLLFPVAGITAVVVEVVVYMRLNWHSGIGRVVSIVVLVNAASTLIGFLIALVLPTGLIEEAVPHGEQFVEIVKPGPQYATYLIGACIGAFLLSVAVEYGIVRRLAAWARIKKPLLTVAVANVASYIALLAVTWAWAEFMW